MAFSISNQAFEDVFGKEAVSPKESFYKVLGNYLKGKKNPSAVLIGSWMEKGKTLNAFTCRADVVLPLMETFRDMKIPYVLVEEPFGDIGVIVRQCDADKTKKAVRMTMKPMAHACGLMTGKEAEMLYLKSNNEDKMMLQVAGLTQEEVICLAETAGGILPGEAVGVDALSDGTYLFTCHGRTAMSAAGKKSFGGALTETMLLLNGESSQAMKRKEQGRARYLKTKSEGFPDRFGYNDDPVWIVGNGQRYVKRESSGFELGHAATGKGLDVELVPDLRVASNEKRFEERLGSALSRITGHICLYSHEDVLEWFSTKRGFIPDKAVAGQQLLSSKADAMVSAKILNDNVMRMEGRWDTKLRHYMSEMKQLLGALKGGRMPEGFKKEDMAGLFRTAQAFQLDMQKMAPVVNRVAAIDIYGRDAGPQKVYDVQLHIEQMSGRGGREDDRSRTRSGERTPAKSR